MKIIKFSSPLLYNLLRGNISKSYFSKFCYSTNSFKWCLILFTLFQVVISDSFAQNFFPLKVGNAYQIEDNWYWHVLSFGDSGTDYKNLIVQSDTLINGELFYSFTNNIMSYPPFDYNCLFRSDSLNQKLLIRIPNDSTTRLAVDFSVPLDSQYTSFIRGEPLNFTSLGYSFKIVLDDTFMVYSMKHPMGGGEAEYTYEFAANIGPSKYKYYIIDQGYDNLSNQDLIAAIVDSVIYNPLVLSVDSLYPTFDRPVDTFPYLLTIQYTASYSALVDSFCLDAQQLRADTLVQNKKYNISTDNPHISLYFAGLFAGDKIKLRTTITDTSIFYNMAHYPYTGWVVMNVLPPILNVENEITPQFYKLSQNYPNPFNPITRIRYLIPEPAFVTIIVYDVLGNEIETLVNEEKIAGSYEIQFDASKLTSGIYYYKIWTEKFSQVKKMILLK